MGIKDAKYTIHRGIKGDEKTGKEVRDFIQRLLERSINVSTLIGSGASYPAIPLMSMTFDEFCKELENSSSQNKKFEALLTTIKKQQGLDIKATQDIESFLSWLGHRHDGGVDNKTEQQIFKRLNNRFVTSVTNCDYKSRQGLSVLDNYTRVIQGLGRSREILPPSERMRAGVVNLFTTNYDLFHEYALERSRYAYTDGFTNGTRNLFQVSEFHQRPVDLEDRFRERLNPINPFFRLVKLHGSANWRVDDGEVLRIPTGLTDKNSDQVLIAPTSSKYAQTQGAPFSDLFREFVNVLAERNTILFTTGFSFADDHITKIIENALSRSDFTLVAFVGSPNQEIKGEKPADTRFLERTQSSNAYFIYPMQDPLGHIEFEDVAEFFGPNALDSSISEAPDSENDNE